MIVFAVQLKRNDRLAVNSQLHVLYLFESREHAILGFQIVKRKACLLSKYSS